MCERLSTDISGLRPHRETGPSHLLVVLMFDGEI